jgi:hypothetical protein
MLGRYQKLSLLYVYRFTRHGLILMTGGSERLTKDVLTVNFETEENRFLSFLRNSWPDKTLRSPQKIVGYCNRVGTKGIFTRTHYDFKKLDNISV